MFCPLCTYNIHPSPSSSIVSPLNTHTHSHEHTHTHTHTQFKVEDETLMEELERMERRFSVYNRMRLKDAQRSANNTLTQSCASDVISSEYSSSLSLYRVGIELTAIQCYNI